MYRVVIFPDKENFNSFQNNEDAVSKSLITLGNKDKAIAFAQKQRNLSNWTQPIAVVDLSTDNIVFESIEDKEQIHEIEQKKIKKVDYSPITFVNPFNREENQVSEKEAEEVKEAEAVKDTNEVEVAPDTIKEIKPKENVGEVEEETQNENNGESLTDINIKKSNKS